MCGDFLGLPAVISSLLRWLEVRFSIKATSQKATIDALACAQSRTSIIIIIDSLHTTIGVKVRVNVIILIVSDC